MISTIKEIAAEHDDIELFKLACELEKEAGALQMAGEQLVGYARKKGLNTFASALDTNVGDLIRHGVSSSAGALKSSVKPLASAASTVSHAAAGAATGAAKTSGKMYRMGEKVIDEQTYNRLPIDGFARQRFKPIE